MMNEWSKADLSRSAALRDEPGSPIPPITPFLRRGVARSLAFRTTCRKVEAKIARITVALAHRRGLRRAYSELLRLDERMLRDIGVTRAEVNARISHIESAPLGEEERHPATKSSVWL